MSSPFEFVNAINQAKGDIMVDDIEEKSYSSYMVNRSFSYFLDTTLLANEMNINHHLDNRLQFDFLINTIRKAKRFSKWAKADYPKDLEVVKEYYGYSNDKAKVALTLLDNEQINELRLRVYKGGTTKRKL
tara:strand:- start:2221 stop:2613 length:393 start_codon:yes stop_codon:yes gene_type:complete